MVMPNYIGFAELKGVGEGDSYQIMHYVNVVIPLLLWHTSMDLYMQAHELIKSSRIEGFCTNFC